MAELIETCPLGDAELKIWKVDCISVVPEDARFLRFVQGTTAYSNPYGGRQDLSYWRIHFFNAFQGTNMPEIRDIFYFAEVDGEIAARLWFAYAPANNFGNFGNIFTLPEYRRRGILRKMMPHCIRDFNHSPVISLACATGNEFAARTYTDYGFKLIYGGITGTMALVKEECGSFLELAERYLADFQTAVCREGRIGDQFLVDKFLRYCPDLNGKMVHSQLLDYRCCMLETRNGNGALSVLENGAGAITGYAWGGSVSQVNRLAFMIHPRVGKADAVKLLKHLSSNCDEPLLYFQNKEDGYGASLLEETGAAVIDTLPDGTVIWRLQ